MTLNGWDSQDVIKFFEKYDFITEVQKEILHLKRYQPQQLNQSLVKILNELKIEEKGHRNQIILDWNQISLKQLTPTFALQRLSPPVEQKSGNEEKWITASNTSFQEKKKNPNNAKGTSERNSSSVRFHDDGSLNQSRPDNSNVKKQDGVSEIDKINAVEEAIDDIFFYEIDDITHDEEKDIAPVEQVRRRLSSSMSPTSRSDSMTGSITDYLQRTDDILLPPRKSFLSSPSSSFRAVPNDLLDTITELQQIIEVVNNEKFALQEKNDVLQEQLDQKEQALLEAKSEIQSIEQQNQVLFEENQKLTHNLIQLREKYDKLVAITKRTTMLINRRNTNLQKQSTTSGNDSHQIISMKRPSRISFRDQQALGKAGVTTTLATTSIEEEQEEDDDEEDDKKQGNKEHDLMEDQWLDEDDEKLMSMGLEEMEGELLEPGIDLKTITSDEEEMMMMLPDDIFEEDRLLTHQKVNQSQYRRRSVVKFKEEGSQTLIIGPVVADVDDRSNRNLEILRRATIQSGPNSSRSSLVSNRSRMTLTIPTVPVTTSLSPPDSLPIEKEDIGVQTERIHNEYLRQSLILATRNGTKTEGNIAMITAMRDAVIAAGHTHAITSNATTPMSSNRTISNAFPTLMMTNNFNHDTLIPFHVPSNSLDCYDKATLQKQLVLDRELMTTLQTDKQLVVDFYERELSTLKTELADQKSSYLYKIEKLEQAAKQREQDFIDLQQLEKDHYQQIQELQQQLEKGTLLSTSSPKSPPMINHLIAIPESTTIPGILSSSSGSPKSRQRRTNISPSRGGRISMLPDSSHSPRSNDANQTAPSNPIHVDPSTSPPGITRRRHSPTFVRNSRRTSTLLNPTVSSASKETSPVRGRLFSYMSTDGEREDDKPVIPTTTVASHTGVATDSQVTKLTSELKETQEKVTAQSSTITDLEAKIHQMTTEKEQQLSLIQFLQQNNQQLLSDKQKLFQQLQQVEAETKARIPLPISSPEYYAQNLEGGHVPIMDLNTYHQYNQNNWNNTSMILSEITDYDLFYQPNHIHSHATTTTNNNNGKGMNRPDNGGRFIAKGMKAPPPEENDDNKYHHLRYNNGHYHPPSMPSPTTSVPMEESQKPLVNPEIELPPFKASFANSQSISQTGFLTHEEEEIYLDPNPAEDISLPSDERVIMNNPLREDMQGEERVRSRLRVNTEPPDLLRNPLNEENNRENHLFSDIDPRMDESNGELGVSDSFFLTQEQWVKKEAMYLAHIQYLLELLQEISESYQTLLKNLQYQTEPSLSLIETSDYDPREERAHLNPTTNHNYPHHGTTHGVGFPMKQNWFVPATSSVNSHHPHPVSHNNDNGNTITPEQQQQETLSRLVESNFQYLQKQQFLLQEMQAFTHQFPTFFTQSNTKPRDFYNHLKRYYFQSEEEQTAPTGVSKGNTGNSRPTSKGSKSQVYQRLYTSGTHSRGNSNSSPRSQSAASTNNHHAHSINGSGNSPTTAAKKVFPPEVAPYITIVRPRSANATAEVTNPHQTANYYSSAKANQLFSDDLLSHDRPSSREYAHQTRSNPSAPQRPRSANHAIRPNSHGKGQPQHSTPTASSSGPHSTGKVSPRHQHHAHRKIVGYDFPVRELIQALGKQTST